ncbi:MULTISPECIES: hypothetical protein [unclassified Methylobacterium]|jgi:hypothetical protein|uniref:hypothetical protein n=1 Tax=unclassified Methylobacterium TaxID=2615210 RepID=UPI0005BB8FA3|nr:MULTISPECIES: hypothetical protein [unclassified Methylobacterium]SFV13026.1 hypothetical protein SAMN02799643_05813 [Methylobacterium sp. UNCCL125]
MDAVTLSELRAITLGARALEDAARKQAERAERLITLIEQETAKSGDAALKRQDGRLTEAGIAALNAAFEAGVTLTEAATQFGIHLSAASYRRSIWRAERSREPQAAVQGNLGEQGCE